MTEAVGHILDRITEVSTEVPHRILGVGIGVLPGVVEHGAEARVHGQSVGWGGLLLGGHLLPGPAR